MFALANIKYCIASKPPPPLPLAQNFCPSGSLSFQLVLQLSHCDSIFTTHKSFLLTQTILPLSILCFLLLTRTHKVGICKKKKIIIIDSYFTCRDWRAIVLKWLPLRYG